MTQHHMSCYETHGLLIDEGGVGASRQILISYLPRKIELELTYTIPAEHEKSKISQLIRTTSRNK